MMDQLALRFLDALEVEEAKLLSWGIVDGGFSIEEVRNHAEQVLSDDDPKKVRSLIDTLLDMRLLFDFNLRGRRLFRTRMAESVRLFARLRQIFPYRNWDISPQLVADYRFSLRPRVYPRRHLTPESVIERLTTEGLLSSTERLALQSLLQSADRGPLQLADFQLHATSIMLRNLSAKKSRGMIVCAGTGTGKTLAFYLPALTNIASLVKQGLFWTKALAIYPRNELLKDQFSETYLEARRLDSLLTSAALPIGRKILIGAFFGLTPRQATIEELRKKKWEAVGTQYICPYLRCPACGGMLGWQQSDIIQEIERLRCTNKACNGLIESDEVILTRERMAETPPDLVFTTTEMLNRQISDSQFGHIFGINANRSPHLVLLDEVHTYSGVHGAQVANLLRRWQHAVGGKVQFAGLSATLRNASDFFSTLTGLTPDAVEEISAAESDDLVSEGMEYQLALRGDPVSATSLLSTSIQAAMLLRRVLDPITSAPSQGAYGTRVFAFTDDLDVTNRLYHNLLDAEGLNSWGRPLAGRFPLAALRAHAASAPAERFRAGQSWLLCEEIGHALASPLQVGRTSSQDTGVDRAADVIVATASLEVGFNDSRVGAVIQHKAPRDMASFLQRKGRAGRPRQMRPWTVVILSDYGRDRMAYQGYDLLFDPFLEERTLPIKNRYVLRIQSVFALMDWVAQQIRTGSPGGSVWNDFSGPATWRSTQKRQQREINLIREVLEDVERRRSLEKHLKSALSLSDEEVSSMLWEPPRALMTSVLPTLLRRLESGWGRVTVRAGESDQDYQVRFEPLPDFVPANLFGELNLPEVRITTRVQRPNEEPLDASMAIAQAMKEFAPGRVSRRYGIRHASASHWIAPPNSTSEEQSLPVERYCTEFEEAGIFQLWEDGCVANIRCVRPRTLELNKPGPEVGLTSNAQLVWRSQIVPLDEGGELELPHNSPWNEIIQEIRFFTHHQRSPVEVRRFALGSRANIIFRKRGKETRELETNIRFTQSEGGQPASIGFAHSVDGLVFRYRLPECFGVRPNDPNQAKVRAFRTAYFRHRILEDQRLAGYANFFQREWLYQVYLSSLTSYALSRGIGLEEARTALRNGQTSEEMARVLDVIFQSLDVDEPRDADENGQDDGAQENHQPTHEKILSLCRTPEVTDVLHDLAKVLWAEPDEEWQRWAAQRFKATLGGALLEACFQLCPQFDSGDLLLDIEPGPRPPDYPPAPEGLEEIWITESTLGGGGVIEEILRSYTADPRHFFHLTESTLDPSDFEIVDVELTRLLEIEQTDPEIAAVMEEMRAAYGNEELRIANERLLGTLSTRGILATHLVMAAINARILRPGSSLQTDRFIYSLIQNWRDEEERLGIEIDARVFAYVKASASDQLDQALFQQGIQRPEDPTWRFHTIYGLLWPRGNVVRSKALSSYNPFAPLPDADRELLLDILRPAEYTIRLDDEDWLAKVTAGLEQGAVVSLTAPSSALDRLKRAVLDLAAVPVELGFLHLYPQVEGVRRELSGLAVRLRLKEAVQ